MLNYIQEGRTLTATAPTGGITSGKAALFGSIIGVAATTAAEGEAVEIAVEGVFEVAKKSTAVIAAFAPVSFNATSGEMDAPGAGLYPAGIATEAAGNGATVVRICLSGAVTAAA